MAEERLRDRAAGGTPRGWSVRIRVLTTVLAFMTVGLAVTGVLTYAAQFRALDQRIDAELWQEFDELELLAVATEEIGRASCRERVYISGGDGTVKEHKCGSAM